MKERFYKIYKHINKTNSKIYIGITIQSPERRWRKGEGYKNNIYFYRAIQKYGWNNFEHIVLFDNLTKEEAEYIEIELISYHNSTNPEFGYNIENGGNLNKEISKETRKKMSIAKKGKMSGENNPNYGKRLSNEHKKRISETRIRLGISKGKNNPRYGTTFNHSEETKQRISKNLSGDKNPMFGRTGKNSPYHREIICLETLTPYSSAREASRELGLIATNITKVCRGKQSHCGGYHFMYLEDYNKNFKTL